MPFYAVTYNVSPEKTSLSNHAVRTHYLEMSEAMAHAYVTDDMDDAAKQAIVPSLVICAAQHLGIDKFAKHGSMPGTVTTTLDDDARVTSKQWCFYDDGEMVGDVLALFDENGCMTDVVGTGGMDDAQARLLAGEMAAFRDGAVHLSREKTFGTAKGASHAYVL